ncbi:MAG: porin family protein [Bacteroidota bacterium]
MKKIIFSLAVIIGSTALLNAQDIQYGVKVGVNLSNLDVAPESDPPAPSMRLGLNVGGFAELGLADNFWFRPELTISTQGANDEDVEVTQKVKLTYLNATFLAKYNLSNSIYLFAGPQVGFLVDGEFEEEDKVSGEQDIFNADAVYKNLDVSVGLGIAYNFDMGIGLDLRYNLGLTDNNDDPQENAFYNVNQELKSRVVQLALSYTF